MYLVNGSNGRMSIRYVYYANSCFYTLDPLSLTPHYLGLKTIPAWSLRRTEAHDNFIYSWSNYDALNLFQRMIPHFVHHPNVQLSTSTFGRLVLGCVETEFNDQLTRSIHSASFSWPEFPKLSLCNISGFSLKGCRKIHEILTNQSGNSSLLMMN